MGYYFFCNDYTWNLLDIVIVASCVVDMLRQLTIWIWDNSEEKDATLSFTFLRVLRLIKVVRILRVVRLMKSFFELRLILSSIFGSLKATFWSLMLIIAIVYILALCFLQGVTNYLKDQGESVDPLLEHSILENWGSIYRGMMSLYMATTGGKDWEEFSSSLEHVGAGYHLFFCLYIAFFYCVVTNTLTSLFVEATRLNADKDHEFIIHDALEKKDEYIEKLKKWYTKIDIDNSGDVSLDELVGHLNDPDVIAFARTLDIEILDVKQFFMMLSCNGSKPVDLESFVIGCIKLKGLAKSMDLLSLMNSSKEIAAKQLDSLRNFEAFCRREFDAIKNNIFVAPAETGAAKSLDLVVAPQASTSPTVFL